jgi:hypothetical protein
VHARRQSKPGREVTRRSELAPIPDGGDNGGRRDRSDTRSRSKPLARHLALVPSENLALNSIHLPVEGIDMIKEAAYRDPSLLWQQIRLRALHALAQFGEPAASLRGNEAEFAEQAASSVDRSRSLPDKQCPHPMQRKDALLRLRLDRHKPHVRARYRFADGLSVSRIGLVPLDIRLDVFRRDQAHVMAESHQRARPMVGTGAGLHPDQARRQFGEERNQLTASKTPPQPGMASVIYAVNLKDGLGEVETDGGDRHGKGGDRHGKFLSLA